MKRIAAFLLVMFSLFSVSAGDYQDIAMSFAPSSTYGYYGAMGLEDSLRADISVSLGLSSRFEAIAGIITELTPDIVDENTFYLEFDYALLGKRSTASKVAGSGINMLLGIGGFYSRTFFSRAQGAGAYPQGMGQVFFLEAAVLHQTAQPFAVDHRCSLLFELILHLHGSLLHR